MAYIFHESELPSLISEVPGRERIFFVNQELAKTDDMLAGVMHYKKGAASPYHLHKNCEHFYFIIKRQGSGGDRARHPAGWRWRYGLHPCRGKAPAARARTAFLFRVAGAQSFQDDDLGRL
jgi:hypothetical protein